MDEQSLPSRIVSVAFIVIYAGALLYGLANILAIILGF